MQNIELALLLGKNIRAEKICTLKQIHIEDLCDQEQYEKYVQYITLISYNTDDVIDLYNARSDYDAMSDKAKANIDAFSLLISVNCFRGLLREALQFFVEERLEYSEELQSFFVYKGQRKSSVINKDTYKKVRDLLLKMNHIKNEKAENERVFANKKAKAIFEKLKKGRKQMSDKNDGTKLTDMISAMSIQSNTYNLLNIGKLTIYQLYDQFSRLDAKTQLDVYGLKWAAWGTEPFDFSMWYKNQLGG